MGQRGKGEGSIYKRPNGSWTTQAYVTLGNGERKRISATSQTYVAAKEKLREIQEHESRHMPYSEKNWLVADYLDYWLEHVQNNRIRETTMSNYAFMIRKYVKPTIGGHKLKYLSVQDVRQALIHLLKKSY